MSSNKYLIQALRAHRLERKDQLDTVILSEKVELTQDAADALEKAEQRIAELESRLIPIQDYPPERTGQMTTHTWQRIASLIQGLPEHKESGYIIRNLIVYEQTVHAVWMRKP